MEEPSGSKRWPGWVYARGEEPDYRFSLANERTLLAWLRTSLGLIAAGVALDAVDLSWSDGAQTAVSAVLILLGMTASAWSLVRWAVNERAMRLRGPLTGGGPGVLLAFGVLVVAVIVIVCLLA